MNPDRIYREYRDDALAKQFTATQYSTFVAMPFQDQFSYRQKEVFALFCEATKKATQQNTARRPFAEPRRVDSGPRVASQVTEEIVVRILESHFFIADLTFENAGVLVETGIALGLKPTKQIILVTQGSPSELHFDINHNTVIRYDNHDAADQISLALIGAAEAFEAECNRYVGSVKNRLTPEAILCLNSYGKRRMVDRTSSLHSGNVEYLRFLFGDELSKLAFQAAFRELIDKNLMQTDYQKGVYSEEHGGPVDKWGGHVTPLGRLFIDMIWPEIAGP
jgi:hypothetical protein